MNAVVQTVKASYVASTKFKRMETNSSVVSLAFFKQSKKYAEFLIKFSRL